MEHTEALTYETLDVHVGAPDMSLITSRWKHSGNGKVYVIIAMTWLGATDEWGFVMQEDKQPAVVRPVFITRPMEHLTGSRANGELRYTRLS